LEMIDYAAELQR